MFDVPSLFLLSAIGIISGIYLFIIFSYLLIEKLKIKKQKRRVYS